MIQSIHSHNSHHKERRFDPFECIKSAGKFPLSNTVAHFSSFHDLWIRTVGRSYFVAVGGLNKWGSRDKHVGKVLTKSSSICYKNKECSNVEYWFSIFIIFRAANTKKLGSGGSIWGFHSGGTWFDFWPWHRLPRLSIRVLSWVRSRECQCNALK
jgi:hypothetical protein